jgi:hypothetical protein
MRQFTEDRDGSKTRRLSASRRGRAGVVLAAAIASLAFASTAAANPPSPPFSECPGYGFDSSCAVLLVINAHGGLESFADPSQGSYVDPTVGNYEYGYDELIGVKNNSSSAVTSIALHGDNIFGFYGKGLCSGLNESGQAGFRPSPGGCPFGLTGYEGPGTSFSGYNEEDSEENANTGTVSFDHGGLQPGKSTYFTLAGRPDVSCQEAGCEPTTLATDLSGDSQSGTTITVSEGSAVSDEVTLSGTNASGASGEVDWSVYRDDECQELVEEGSSPISDGSVSGLGPVTLGPGTYYWRASYGGDSNNGASESACGSEVENVQAKTALSTSLSGGGASGDSISVVDETAVSDQATLTGAEATSASGTVSYKVYSDSQCSDLVAESDVAVSDGVVPASSAQTLGAGTYYWVASYAGDSHNESTLSPCGSEVETVTKPCSAIKGVGQTLAGPNHVGIQENLNTNLADEQKMKLKYDEKSLKLVHLTSARCFYRGSEKIFTGQGSGKVGKVSTYEVSFTVTLAGGHTYLTAVVGKGHAVEAEYNHVQLTKNKEHIS